MLDDEVPATDDDWHSRLCGLGFMTERADGPPVCTIASTVLFAHRPRRLLRQAGVRWMAFAGNDLDYQALDDAVLDGSLVGLWSRSAQGQVFRAQPGLVEQLLERAKPFQSSESAELAENLRRERHWHYPPEALREALLNALVHRDWTRPGEVELVRFGDRLTLTSPCGSRCRRRLHAVDHPAVPVAIRHAAEVRAPEHVLQRHRHRAALGQAVEQPCSVGAGAGHWSGEMSSWRQR